MANPLIDDPKADPSQPQNKLLDRPIVPGQPVTDAMGGVGDSPILQNILGLYHSLNPVKDATVGDLGEQAAYATPGLGHALSGKDMVNAIGDRNWLGAGLGALGAVPLLGGIFGGPLARTADHAALARAVEMKAAGHDAESIWKNTGWFEGADGKPRFEIPDNKSFYRGTTPATSAYADQALSHPDLYKAYPELSDVRITEVPSKSPIGTWGETQHGMELGGPDKSSSALHEFQHAIQDSEGFAQGGSPNIGNIVSDEILPIQSRMRELANAGQASSPEFSALQKQRQDILGRYGNEDPASLYRRLAGEVEARNVQKRMNMTPEERRATPPWETQDVPNNQQIIRGSR